MTDFTLIYDKFLSKITDFSMAQVEQYVLEEDLKNRLLSALAYFPELDDEKKQYTELENEAYFNEELTIEEQEIISTLMVINYLNRFIISEDNMRVQLNSKDYKTYSAAGLLKELKATKTTYEMRVDAQKNSYSFRKMIKKRESNG